MKDFCIKNLFNRVRLELGRVINCKFSYIFIIMLFVDSRSKIVSQVNLMKSRRL